MSPRPSVRRVKRYAKFSLLFYCFYIVVFGFILSGLKAGTLSGIALYTAIAASALPLIGWFVNLGRQVSAEGELETRAMKNAALVGLGVLLIFLMALGAPALLYPDKIARPSAMSLVGVFCVGMFVGVIYWQFKLGLWGKESKEPDA